jgi:hypothetical protein
VNRQSDALSDADQMHAVISLCTNLAGGNLESRALREGGGIRNVGQSWRRSGSDENRQVGQRAPVRLYLTGAPIHHVMPL